MSSNLRAKLASSINNIERPEDWQWNRWLKPPASWAKTCSFSKSSVINKKGFHTFISIPGNDGFVLDTLETPIIDTEKFFKYLKIQSSKSYKITIPPLRTNRLFFSIMPSKASKNYFRERLESNKTSIIFFEKILKTPDIKLIREIETKTIIRDRYIGKEKVFLNSNIVSGNLSNECLLNYNTSIINQDKLIRLLDAAKVSGSLLVSEDKIIIHEIDFMYYTHTFSYMFEFQQVSDICNLLPGDSDTKFIADDNLNRFYFTGSSTEITNNLLSSDSDTKFVDEDKLLRYFFTGYLTNITNSLIPSDSETNFIGDNSLIRFFFTGCSTDITCNLLSSEYLTKFIDTGLLDHYFFHKINLSDNLLPSGSNIDFINESVISKYYFPVNEISGNLASIIPDCFDISLLNASDFDVKLSDTEKINTKLIPGADIILQDQILSKIENIDTPGIFDIPVEKLTPGRKKVQSIQVLHFEYPEVSKNFTSKKLLYKFPYIFFTHFEKLHSFTRKMFNVSELLEYENTPVTQYDTSEFSALLPISDIDIGKQIDSMVSLYDYQRQGVEFLINNHFAILVDDPGLGKTVQSISALKLLFKTGLVRSVLVLCPDLEYGSSDLSLLSGKSEGWEGHFYNWAPELTVKVIKGDEGQRRIDWYDYAQVFIVSLKTLSNDIRKKIIQYDRLKIFSCMIIDDIRGIKEDFLENIKLFESLKLNYLWILNDFPFDYHLDEMIYKIKPIVESQPNENISKFYKSSPEVPSTYLRRQKNDVFNSVSPKIYIDKWIELLPEQRAEYEYTLDVGIKKITDSLETGNILLIQPQIFNLLHQLMQICNYPAKSNASGKEGLLLSQIDTIIKNREKVIILSQYEKQGIKKLEDLLTKNKIDFVTHQTGMSESNLIKNIKDFNSKDNISTFIIDSKALKGILNLGAVTNIIHFDHWWSPLSLWQVEDKIVTSTSRKNISIYTYWALNTVEENIYRLLSKKGMFIKGIVESFSSLFFNEMISTDEWLGILGIESGTPDNYDTYRNSAFEKLNAVPPDVFKEIGKGFLTKLGYSSNKFMSYVDSSGNDIDLTSKIVNKREETIIVKFVHSPEVDIDVVSEFVKTISNYRNISRCFFIASGLFTREARQYMTYKYDKLILIDGLTLSNYLIRYNLI